MQAQILRCTPIMGRSETDELSQAQITYPCMQCADIFFLEVCQALSLFSCCLYDRPSVVSMHALAIGHTWQRLLLKAASSAHIQCSGGLRAHCHCNLAAHISIYAADVDSSWLGAIWRTVSWATCM